MNKYLILKPNRERSLLRCHPWVFSGAVASVKGNPEVGETVAVQSSTGEFLAWAAYSPSSQIRGRVWSWNQDEIVDRGFFRRKILSAISGRLYGLGQAAELQDILNLTPFHSNAQRLVYAESDGIPGFILDRYADTLVAQILTAGTEFWRNTLMDLSMELTGAARLYERSDVDVRKLEGLEFRSGLARGSELTGPLVIEEYGLRFYVDVRVGHKTGYYLDQRFNRHRAGELSSGCEILDCFSYTGGFSLHMLAGGAASVLSVDSSAEALSLAKENLGLNQLQPEKVEWLEGDLFKVLRTFRDSRRTFDMIVLDPPKFAQTAAQAERAARGYKDINLLAFKLLRPGGLLLTFSCSGGVSADLFQKIVAGAAQDAGVNAQILEHLFQAPDHPIALNFPEAAYLKGLVVRVE